MVFCVGKHIDIIVIRGDYLLSNLTKHCGIRHTILKLSSPITIINNLAFYAKQWNILKSLGAVATGTH